jgi:hypothetical protein
LTHINKNSKTQFQVQKLKSSLVQVHSSHINKKVSYYCVVDYNNNTSLRPRFSGSENISAKETKEATGF